MFPDNYPYTNFHELNLGYFIIHFREIFSQWADLYDQMLDWKNATDADLESWKTGVEADLDQREEALRAELETWKAQTGQDIAGWEDATLAALTAWQTATQAVFEAIRVEAAGSATAAAASATDAATAKTAAETAQAAAEAAAASVTASAAQIATNTADISDLKTQIDDFTEGIQSANLTDPSKTYGGVINNDTGAITTPSSYYRVSDKIPVTPGETVYIYQLSVGVMNVRKTVNDKVAFYKSDDTFISIGYNENSYTVPAEAAYCVEQGYYNPMRDGEVGIFKKPLSELGTTWIPYSNKTVIITDKTLTETDVPADAKAVGDAIAGIVIPTDTTLTESDVPADAKTVGDVVAPIRDTTNNYFKQYGTVIVSGSTAYVEQRVEITDFEVGFDYYIKIDKIEGTTYGNHFNVILLDANDDEVQRITVQKSENIDVHIRPGANVAKIVLDYYPKATPGDTTTVTGVYTNVRIIENANEGKTYLKDGVVLYDKFRLPPYYFENSYIQNKAEYILNKYAEAIDDGAGDAFLFVTDSHWGDNAKQSPGLMKYIKSNAFIPRLFHGGDTMMYNVNTEYVEELKTAFDGEIHFIVGNHELYYPTSTGGLAFAELDAGKNDQIGNPQRHYYYVDNVQNGMRYIILNLQDAPSSGAGAVNVFEQAQQDWLEDVALNVPSGYGVIIFLHYFIGIDGYHASIMNELETIVETAKSNGVNIICMITGHTHYDALLNTRNGIPVIVDTSDKNAPWIKNGTNMEPWLSDRVTGTIREQAFDAVVVNMHDEYIRFIRIGGLASNAYIGSTTSDLENPDLEERIVHYNKITVSGTETLTAMITPNTWASSDTSICTVNSGVVTSVGTGVAYVYAKDTSGVLEAWIIEVE